MTEWLSVLLPLWLTAFMAGLLGSGHCFAMCGGIAGSLGVTGLSKSDLSKRVLGKREQEGHAASVWKALQFNLGRIFGYAIAGAVTALLLGGISHLAGLQAWTVLLRVLTALLVLLIGFHYLFEWRGLNTVERWGARVWAHILPFANRFASRPGVAARLMLGLCWGFLPCGLVYTLLLTAASTANAAAGASVMLAFGMGTLPSMLGLTLAAPALATVLKDRDFRRFIGLSLVLLAVWMLFSMYSMGGFNTAANEGIHHLRGS